MTLAGRFWPAGLMFDTPGLQIVTEMTDRPHNSPSVRCYKQSVHTGNGMHLFVCALSFLSYHYISTAAGESTLTALLKAMHFLCKLTESLDLRETGRINTSETSSSKQTEKNNAVMGDEYPPESSVETMMKESAECINVRTKSTNSSQHAPYFHTTGQHIESLGETLSAGGVMCLEASPR